MSWEKRKAENRYYTRSYRRNGRVVREYFGRGEMVELIAEHDKTTRSLRESEAAELRAEKERDQSFLLPFDTLDDAINCLSKGTLIAHGFHQHKRSEWRRRNDPSKT